MKCFTALILSLLLLAGILVPTVLADNTQRPSSEVTSSQQETANSPASEEGGGSSAAPEQSTPAAAGPLDLTSVQNAAAAKNTATALHFSDLRSVLTKYNSNILYMKASLSALSDSVSSMDSSIATLQGLQTGVDTALKSVKAFLADPANQNPTDDAGKQLLDIYNSLEATLGTSSALLAMQVLTMQSQTDSLDLTEETTKNTINDSINQIIKGAETLYIALVTMDASVSGVERTIAALDRAISIYEQQQKLGMASAYDVETMKYQRSQAASGLESLKFQIKTNKISLESMCGMELSGGLELDRLSAPTQEELDSVNYEKNLTSATSHNVDVLNADAKRYNESSDFNSAKKEYQAAMDSFACSYKLVCLTVPEKERLVQTAQETVDYQQRTFEIAEKKYSLGMLSHEDYLSAQNALSSAQDDLYSAQLDLFSAYRNYVWATQYGIA